MDFEKGEIGMKAPILRVRDENGNLIPIPAIVGPRGPAGEGGGVTYVTMTRNGGTYTADKAYEETYAAIMDGKNVSARYTASDGMVIVGHVTGHMDNSEGYGCIMFGAITYLNGVPRFHNIFFLPDETAFITAIPLEPGTA